MIKEGKENRLLNASLYLRNAILELRAIPCQCGEEYCDRCFLIDDVTNLQKDIDKEFQKTLNKEVYSE